MPAIGPDARPSLSAQPIARSTQLSASFQDASSRVGRCALSSEIANDFSSNVGPDHMALASAFNSFAESPRCSRRKAWRMERICGVVSPRTGYGDPTYACKSGYAYAFGFALARILRTRSTFVLRAFKAVRPRPMATFMTFPKAGTPRASFPASRLGTMSGRLPPAAGLPPSPGEAVRFGHSLKYVRLSSQGHGEILRMPGHRHVVRLPSPRGFRCGTPAEDCRTREVRPRVRSDPGRPHGPRERGHPDRLIPHVSMTGARGRTEYP